MRIIELLEGATDVLYHYTSLHATADIFREGAFLLSAALGTRSELSLQPPGHAYYFSTTRSKTGRYHRFVSDNAVMFVLDGQWFQQRYKVKPVDYWAGMSDTETHSESEDRVYSKENRIPLGGVRALHILFRHADGTESSLLRKILISAKTRGIETHVYDDLQSWRLQNVRGALDTDDILTLTQGEISPDYRAYTARRAAEKTQILPRDIAAWVELLKTPASQYNKLSPITGKLAFAFRHNREYDVLSYMTSLKNDIHNYRSARSGPEYKHLVKLIRAMRKLGITDIEDLVQYLRDKWRVKQVSK